MTEIISKDLVQERIDKYIQDNEEEIIVLIDKKIETKVKEAIRDIFNYGWHKTHAAVAIEGKVEAVIALQAEKVSIDEDWVEQQVQKKVKSTVKNLKVTL